MIFTSEIIIVNFMAPRFMFDIYPTYVHAIQQLLGYGVYDVLLFIILSSHPKEQKKTGRVLSDLEIR